MSITSMSARMGMAEKLDVQQLTKAVQDGTVPSYIGIPLIQQKMQESQQAKAMVQPQRPPIAQQVMQQWMQMPDVTQRYQGDETFKARVDTRAKQIQQAIVQQQNAQTGRLGANFQQVMQKQNM